MNGVKGEMRRRIRRKDGRRLSERAQMHLWASKGPLWLLKGKRRAFNYLEKHKENSPLFYRKGLNWLFDIHDVGDVEEDYEEFEVEHDDERLLPPGYV